MKLTLKYLALSLLIVLVLPTHKSQAAEVTSTELPAPTGWSAFQEGKLGATIYFPSNWFHPGSPYKMGYMFTSLHQDGAYLFLKTEIDEMRTGAAATVAKLKSMKGKHQITRIESGDMFYEISITPVPGMKQLTRVVYTCKERVVSAVTMMYPEKQAAKYEAMFAKLKRRFNVGVGAQTPVRSCS